MQKVILEYLLRLVLTKVVKNLNVDTRELIFSVADRLFESLRTGHRRELAEAFADAAYLLADGDDPQRNLL